MAQNNQTGDPKPWQRPWTTQEMIANAPSWNLAGDAGLLLHLQKFSDDLIMRSNETIRNLNSMNDQLIDTEISLRNVTNRFMGLQNTQFVESRVYEEDEMAATEAALNKNTTDNNEKTESVDNIDKMRELIDSGLEFVKTYYEEVEVPDENGEGTRITYRQKDPYADRPLPCIIGSAEWFANDIGLSKNTSKTVETISLLESDQESEPEEVSGNQIVDDNVSQPMYDPTKLPKVDPYNIAGPAKDLFGSGSESEPEVPVSNENANVKFAAELAAKLGHVTGEKVPSQNEPRSKTEEKKSTNLISGNIFFDEPPPIDETDRNVFNSDVSKTGGLFDDLDDKLLWGTTKPPPNENRNESGPRKNPVNDLFGDEDEEDDIFFKSAKKDLSAEETVKIRKESKGLFDDSDSDELFSSANSAPNKKSYLSPLPGKSIPPLINDEPPPIVSCNAEKKKPAGAVSVLPGKEKAFVDGLAKLIKNRRQSSSDSEDIKSVTGSDRGPSTEEKRDGKIDTGSVTSDINKSISKKPTSLFSDSKDSKLPEKVSRKPLNLFGDEEFSENSNVPKDKSARNPMSLFGDDDDIDDFIAQVKSNKGKSKNKDLINSLFDDDEDPFDFLDKKKSNLFEKKSDLVDDQEPDRLFASSKLKTESLKTVEKKTNSFEDDSSKNEKATDIFADLNVETIKPNIDIFANTEIKKDIFGDTQVQDHSKNIDSDTKLIFSTSNKNTNIFASIEPELRPSSSTVKIKQPNVRVRDSAHGSNLFDDAEEDDIFAEVNLPKKNSSDVKERHKTDIECEPKLDDLKRASVASSNYSESLFESLPPDFEKPPEIDDKNYDAKSETDSLFDYSETNEGAFGASGVFDSEPPPISTLNVSQETNRIEPRSENENRDDLFNINRTDELAAGGSLFDDGDDLFSSSKNRNLFKNQLIPDDLFGDDGNFFNKPKLENIEGESKLEKIDSTESSDFTLQKGNVSTNDNLFRNRLILEDLFSDEGSLFSESKSENITAKESKVEKIDSAYDKNVFADTSKNLSSDNNTFKTVVDPNSEDKNIQKPAANEFETILTGNLTVQEESAYDAFANKKPHVERPSDFSESLKSVSSTNNEQDFKITGSPGKLKRSLEINVAALLPGASPVKITAEKSVGFDIPTDNVETLPNSQKDRVRIPVKRRPPSRTARQKALRESGSDFNIQLTLPSAELENKDAETEPDKKLSEISIEKNTFSPLTEEDDIFIPGNVKENSPRLSVPTIFRSDKISEDLFDSSDSDLFSNSGSLGNPKENLFAAEKSKTDLSPDDTLFKPKTDSNKLFEDEAKANIDGDLFGGVGEKLKSAEKKPSPSLFSDDDEDDALFAPTKKIKPLLSQSAKPETKSDNLFGDSDTEDLFCKKRPSQQIVKKKSIFDDSEDDDSDIFGSRRVLASSSKSQSTVAAKNSTVSAPKKLTQVNPEPVFDDPLTALNK